MPYASLATDGTVTVTYPPRLSGPLPEKIALEMPEWNRALILLERKMLDRIRECKKPDCKKPFWARFSHSEYHSEACRLAVEAANPVWKERRRDHMRAQREAEKVKR